MAAEPTPLAALLSLHGRRALVTGAGAGIGEAIALRLAEAGADLDLVDVDPTALTRLEARLAPTGRTVATHHVDLADEVAVRALWDDLTGREPDVLINNAGVYPFQHFVDLDARAYRRVLAVNLDAAVWSCQRMIRGRGRRGGVIVNVGSVEALLPFKDDAAVYSASKAAVIALTRALAKEHGRHGFRVNAIVPGGIVTPGTRAVARDLLRGRLVRIREGVDFVRRVPIGRLGRPDEVARMAVVLASDLAAYVHGAAIVVDGGFLSA
jgi:NAD(P)-dependent dehydrogenase (short-subunit alcohol dehydrogenase family)